MKIIAIVLLTGHYPVMSKMLSPQKAADKAGCGRSSIMRALTSGELKATRNNSGRWQITPEALEDWMELRPDDRSRPAITKDIDGDDRPEQVDTPETLARLATAEARIEGLEARLMDTQAERDRLAGLLDRALEPRPSIIDRIFRR